LDIESVDSNELNAMLQKLWQAQHGADAPLPEGTYSTLLFQGNDLQQDTLSPDYVLRFAAATVVPTIGPALGTTGTHFDSGRSVSSLAARFDQP
jgi:hypothetical protein